MGTQPPMVYVRETIRWEYKQLVCKLGTDQPPSVDHLNTLGAEGWELVGAFTDSSRAYFYFKRPGK